MAGGCPIARPELAEGSRRFCETCLPDTGVGAPRAGPPAPRKPTLGKKAKGGPARQKAEPTLQLCDPCRLLTDHFINRTIGIGVVSGGGAIEVAQTIHYKIVVGAVVGRTVEVNQVFFCVAAA